MNVDKRYFYNVVVFVTYVKGTSNERSIILQAFFKLTMRLFVHALQPYPQKNPIVFPQGSVEVPY
jgi:hypothetical protein